MTPAEAALVALYDAAKRMPRGCPGGGGAGTAHDFKIEAWVVWELDKALTEAGKAIRAANLLTRDGDGE